VYLRLPFFRIMEERRQRQFKKGTAYKATVQYAEMDSLFQEYTDNETLQGGEKVTDTTVQWYRKNAQLPLELKSMEDMENRDGGGDGQIFDIRQRLVINGQRGMRLAMSKLLYRAGDSNRDQPSSANAQFQGLKDALAFDVSYGGKTRANSTTNSWWQSADITATAAWATATQTTAVACSIANFRRIIDRVQRYATTDSPDNLLFLCGNTNYRTLQSQVESQRIYKAGPHAEFGFTSMTIDGVEIIADPYLDLGGFSTNTFMLHLPDWHLMLSPKRRLGYVTDLEWQGKYANGTDKLLGRVMLQGNIICTQPNASCYQVMS
jgi:hypothetical protein